MVQDDPDVKPATYAESEAELRNLVRLAAALRAEMVADNFNPLYADEVSKAFLWYSLGLPNQ